MREGRGAGGSRRWEWVVGPSRGICWRDRPLETEETVDRRFSFAYMMHRSQTVEDMSTKILNGRWIGFLRRGSLSQRGPGGRERPSACGPDERQRHTPTVLKVGP